MEEQEEDGTIAEGLRAALSYLMLRIYQGASVVPSPPPVVPAFNRLHLLPVSLCASPRCIPSCVLRFSGMFPMDFLSPCIYPDPSAAPPPLFPFPFHSLPPFLHHIPPFVVPILRPTHHSTSTLLASIHPFYPPHNHPPLPYIPHILSLSSSPPLSEHATPTPLLPPALIWNYHLYAVFKPIPGPVCEDKNQTSKFSPSASQDFLETTSYARFFEASRPRLLRHPDNRATPLGPGYFLAQTKPSQRVPSQLRSGGVPTALNVLHSNTNPSNRAFQLPLQHQYHHTHDELLQCDRKLLSTDLPSRDAPLPYLLAKAPWKVVCSARAQSSASSKIPNSRTAELSLYVVEAANSCPTPKILVFGCSSDASVTAGK
ncbi:hypothetical protein C8J57DRAFT_1480926 [Mycena rebaudengoi]|nr:hypothetical protein C8J57DRAFT_1480926 [Mycena rebaudengoi]